jgi:hypothetical protein
MRSANGRWCTRDRRKRARVQYGRARKSAAAGRLFGTRDFCERSAVSSNGFGDRATVNELAFALAGDQAGVAQNLEMMRDGGGSDAAQGDDLAAVHLPGCRNGLEYSETRFVGQGFRDSLNLRTVHESAEV